MTLGLMESSWGAVSSPCVISQVTWPSIFLFPAQFPCFPLFCLLALNSQRKEWEHLVWHANSLGTLGICDSPFTSDNINYYFFHPDPEGHAGGGFPHPSRTPGPEQSSVWVQWLCPFVFLLPGSRTPWAAAQPAQVQPGGQQYSAGKHYATALKTSTSFFLDFSSSNCYHYLAQLPFSFFPLLSS